MGKHQNDYICEDDRAADGTAYSKEDSVKIRVVNPNAGDPKKTKKSKSRNNNCRESGSVEIQFR
ncbi:MAG: hypothetical protein J6Y83_05405 [Bacteroidales bacterium]|nr:hypothetical protein [Bacteroidales bacterium]